MRALSGPARDLALAWGLGALGLLATIPWATRLGELSPGCLWHHLTGVACPTCGTTRAMQALFSGNIMDALAWNPLVAVGATLFAVGGLLAGAVALLRIPVPRPRRAPSGAMVAWGLAALVLAQWVYLIARGV